MFYAYIFAPSQQRKKERRALAQEERASRENALFRSEKEGFPFLPLHDIGQKPEDGVRKFVSTRAQEESRQSERVE